MARCRPTFNVKTLTVGFRPLPQTTRWGTKPGRRPRAARAGGVAPPRSSASEGRLARTGSRSSVARQVRARITLPPAGDDELDPRQTMLG